MVGPTPHAPHVRRPYPLYKTPNSRIASLYPQISPKFTKMEKPTTASRAAANRKLTRQRSRLQMHAPSSIEVAPATAAAAASVEDWKAAIPLLSPLDIVSLPGSWDRTAAESGEAEEAVRETRQPSDEEERRAMKWATWQHQAPSIYYEPVAGNGPAFLLPYCV